MDQGGFDENTTATSGFRQFYVLYRDRQTPFPGRNADSSVMLNSLCSPIFFPYD